MANQSMLIPLGQLWSRLNGQMTLILRTPIVIYKIHLKEERMIPQNDLNTISD